MRTEPYLVASLTTLPLSYLTVVPACGSCQFETNEDAAIDDSQTQHHSMSFWQNGALPFQLVQFDELAHLEPGTKVRFLCW